MTTVGLRTGRRAESREKTPTRLQNRNFDNGKHTHAPPLRSTRSLVSPNTSRNETDKALTTFRSKSRNSSSAPRSTPASRRSSLQLDSTSHSVSRCNTSRRSGSTKSSSSKPYNIRQTASSKRPSRNVSPRKGNPDKTADMLRYISRSTGERADQRLKNVVSRISHSEASRAQYEDDNVEDFKSDNEISSLEEYPDQVQGRVFTRSRSVDRRPTNTEYGESNSAPSIGAYAYGEDPLDTCDMTVSTLGSRSVVSCFGDKRRKEMMSQNLPAPDGATHLERAKTAYERARAEQKRTEAKHKGQKVLQSEGSDIEATEYLRNGTVNGKQQTSEYLHNGIVNEKQHTGFSHRNRSSPSFLERSRPHMLQSRSPSTRSMGANREPVHTYVESDSDDVQDKVEQPIEWSTESDIDPLVAELKYHKDTSQNFKQEAYDMRPAAQEASLGSNFTQPSHNSFQERNMSCSKADDSSFVATFKVTEGNFRDLLESVSKKKGKRGQISVGGKEANDQNTADSNTSRSHNNRGQMSIGGIDARDRNEIQVNVDHAGLEYRSLQEIANSNGRQRSIRQMQGVQPDDETSMRNLDNTSQADHSCYTNHTDYSKQTNHTGNSTHPPMPGEGIYVPNVSSVNGVSSRNVASSMSAGTGSVSRTNVPNPMSTHTEFNEMLDAERFNERNTVASRNSHASSGISIPSRSTQSRSAQSRNGASSPMITHVGFEGNSETGRDQPKSSENDASIFRETYYNDVDRFKSRRMRNTISAESEQITNDFDKDQLTNKADDRTNRIRESILKKRSKFLGVAALEETEESNMHNLVGGRSQADDGGVNIASSEFSEDFSERGNPEDVDQEGYAKKFMSQGTAPTLRSKFSVPLKSRYDGGKNNIPLSYSSMGDTMSEEETYSFSERGSYPSGSFLSDTYLNEHHLMAVGESVENTIEDTLSCILCAPRKYTWSVQY
eukprot:CAMPEP_0194287374 /NCGR_PEP_ID=MMETSP0169-20130528/34602_1 /TAXON_ID=218684 /ORGANISM="Corethron pennatum, Strain L29A3" /LENGTH=950 /DNA_ID=CAMNT_0039034053 /DNA_START=250 /DNA_END=3102 /DNA_ORIENTATION=-